MCVTCLHCLYRDRAVCASAVLFPFCLAGRQDMLVLAATVPQSSWHGVEMFRTHYLLWTSTLYTTPLLSLSITTRLMDCATG